MISLAVAALLLLAWILLWGSFSIANVASGLLVAVALIAWIPELRFSIRRLRLRPVAIARFGTRVAVDLVRANWVVTREILSRGSTIRTGIVEVELPTCSDVVVTVVANVLGLAPGTMPIEVRRDPVRISIHVLHLHDGDEIRRQVLELADLTMRAFGEDPTMVSIPDGAAVNVETEGPR